MVHREESFQSVNFMSVAVARPRLRRSHKRKPCNKKDALAEQHDLAKNIYKLKNAEKASIYSPIEIEAAPAHISKSQRNENSWLIPEHQCTC